MEKKYLWWLAGLIDGEGHFGIYVNNKRKDGGKTYRAELSLKLRDDDKEVLEFCRELTGLGKIYNVYKGRKTRDGNGKPQTMWKVVKKSEILELANLLDRAELRTKKAREYIYWRRAVHELQKPSSPEREKAMAYCKRMMQELRIYKKASED